MYKNIIIENEFDFYVLKHKIQNSNNLKQELLKNNIVLNSCLLLVQLENREVSKLIQNFIQKIRIKTRIFKKRKLIIIKNQRWYRRNTWYK